MSFEGLSPPPLPNKNMAPKETKPICPFWRRLMFFARFVSEKVMYVVWIVIIFDQLKEPPAWGFFFRFENFGLEFSRN